MYQVPSNRIIINKYLSSNTLLSFKSNLVVSCASFISNTIAISKLFAFSRKMNEWKIVRCKCNIFWVQACPYLTNLILFHKTKLGKNCMSHQYFRMIHLHRRMIHKKIA